MISDEADKRLADTSLMVYYNDLSKITIISKRYKIHKRVFTGWWPVQK